MIAMHGKWYKCEVKGQPTFWGRFSGTDVADRLFMDDKTGCAWILSPEFVDLDNPLDYHPSDVAFKKADENYSSFVGKWAKSLHPIDAGQWRYLAGYDDDANRFVSSSKQGDTLYYAPSQVDLTNLMPFHPGCVISEKEVNANSFSLAVTRVTDEIRDLLIEKNKSYGNAALDPVRVFSKADATEQLLVRIDDKISRIQRGTEFPSEDTITDLIGYLVLLKIAKNQNK